MIGDVCIKPVVTISPKASVRDAARLMRQRNVGALVMRSHASPMLASGATVAGLGVMISPASMIDPSSAMAPQREVSATARFSAARIAVSGPSPGTRRSSPRRS